MNNIKNYHVLVVGLLMIVIPANILAIKADIGFDSFFVMTNCIISIVFGVILGIISLARMSGDFGGKGGFKGGFFS